MSLSDHFPDSLKNDYSHRNLDVGKVLKLRVKDTNPPKTKRFIIVGFTDDTLSLASVYINSDINLRINWSEEQRRLQIEFSPANRSYLDRTSYIDCSKLIVRESEEIRSAIKKRPDAVIGELSREDLDAVVGTLRDAKTISKNLKRQFGFFR